MAIFRLLCSPENEELCIEIQQESQILKLKYVGYFIIK